MKFLATEEGKIGSVAAVNIMYAAISPWGVTESALRLLLLIGQIAVAYLTAWYVYRKVRGQNKDDSDQ